MGKTKPEIAERIKAIIVDRLGCHENEVTEDAKFEIDLGADSLDTTELIMEFEQEFRIKFIYDETKKIITVSDATNYFYENQDKDSHKW